MCFELWTSAGIVLIIVNVLSQNPSFEGETRIVTTAWVLGLEGIHQEVIGDERPQGIIQNLLDNLSFTGELRRGRLLYKGRVVLPGNSTNIQKFMAELHSFPYGGHLVFFQTYEMTVVVLFWKGMKNNITRYVTMCETYQCV